MRAALSAVGSILFLATLAVAQSGAFIVGPGTHGATMGGAALLPGTAIIPGEVITTGPGGAIVMAQSGKGGGIVQMGQDSTATVTKTAGVATFDLNSGSAAVTGISAQTPQGAVVQPQSTHSEYVINSGSASSSVGVLSGSVQLTDTSTPTSPVSAGKAVSVVLVNGQVDTSTTNIADISRPSSNSSVTDRPPASASH